MTETIERYFPDLSERQKEQFRLLGEIYPEWNEKINVISRKDIDHLYVNHVLHSLAIGKFLMPQPGTSFVDIGTGGGFPGIPLAILYPECSFHLVDRIKKKIMVVDDVVGRLELKNVTTQSGDLGECHLKFNYAISRAAMKLPLLVKIARKNIARGKTGNKYRNGVVALKGGDLQQELKELNLPYIEMPISVWFNEDYFKTKDLIYVPIP